MKRFALALLIAVSGSEGCTEPAGPTLLPVLNTVVVSQALSPSSVGIAYVSLPQGTLPTGQTATIRSPSGAQVTTALQNGGWDPVLIAAQAGDTLRLTIATASGENLEFTAGVPVRTRPIVVRTSPPPGKRDVPLNASLLVVFSEPMDPRSINPASVQLLRNGQAVGGALVMGPGSPWVAQLVPSQSLAPGADYQLVVTQSARDVDGESLDAQVTVQFTTESVAPPLPAIPAGVVAFVSTLDGAAHIYLANTDGSGLRRLTRGMAEESAPAWSPDGTRLAFNRGTAIYLINADGSDERVLPNTGRWPSWSPDGTQLLATGDGAAAKLRIMNLDQAGITELLPQWATTAVRARWSPDGQRIVFEGWVDGPDQWVVLEMNRDGTGSRDLASSGRNGAPAWSPDGARVVRWSFNYGIAIIDRNTLAEQIVGFQAKWPGLDGPMSPSASIDWSPDGQTLLLSLPDAVEPSRFHGGTGWHLWMLDLKTKRLRRLTPTSSGEEWDAVWKP